MNIPNLSDATSGKADPAERRRHAQSSAVRELSNSSCILEGDVEATARQLTELAARVTGVARASVWLFNEAEDELRCIDLHEAATGRHSSGMLRREQEFQNEFKALKQAPYVDANEPLADPRVRGYLEGYIRPLGITSLLTTGVEISGKHFGLLCLEHVGRPHQWTSDEITFAERFADKMAVTLSLKSARRAADEARTLARLPQESPNAVMRLSADGRVLYANPASVSLKSVCGAAVGETVSGRILELLRECMASGAVHEMEMKDGTESFAIQLTPIAAEGYANLYAKDITPYKRVEAALVASRDLFASAVENVPARVFWKDADLRFVGCNRIFARDAGFAHPEELVGKDDFQMPWRAQAELYRADDRMVMESGEPKLGVEEPTQSSDGRTGWVRTTKVPWHGVDGKTIGILAMSVDITERREAEERARFNSAVLQTQHETSLDGIYVVDQNQRMISLNRRFVEMWGLSDEVVASRSDERAIEAVLGHFESPDEFLAAVKELYEHKDRKLHDELHLKDGRTIDRYSSPMIGADGAFMGRVFYFRDITARRRAEESVRQSAERFRGFFELGLIGMAITLPDKGISEVNGKFCEIFGYSREELLCMDWASLTHPDDLAADVDRFNRVLGGEIDSYVLDKRFIRKSGDAAYCTISVSSVRRADGSVHYIVALIHDITERKVADRKLHEALTSTIEAIAATIETRDPYTAGHQRCVADLAAAIAREMGLPPETIEGVRFGALIHDLGKIQVPTELLTKPTRLSKLEMELIKTHAQAGYEIVKGIKFPWPVAEMVHEHHERIDGTGYPQGLSGDAIALEARIIGVADTVEAMASHRPYRPGLGIDRALKEIQDRRGNWFDPAVVDACLRLFREKGYEMKTGTFG